VASVGSGEIPSREIAFSLRYYFGEMLDDHYSALNCGERLSSDV